jgi:tRNA (cmo5U34)-methyltransferase
VACCSELNQILVVPRRVVPVGFGAGVVEWMESTALPSYNPPMSNLGDGISADNASWTFAGVSDHFDTHVSRSVPFYHEGQDLIVRVADYFLLDDSTCYDLGCSTGTLLKRLAEHNQSKRIRFFGIDVEEGMVRKAADKCRGHANIEVLQYDILELELQKTDLVILYYTMQFVRPRNRQMMFDRIYAALNWGGALLCFEKVRGADARFQDILTGVYTEFKIEQGYTSEEMVAKTRSLKGVLEPFSTEGNLNLMKRAGFVDVMSVFKYACFEGFLAIK